MPKVCVVLCTLNVCVAKKLAVHRQYDKFELQPHVLMISIYVHCKYFTIQTILGIHWWKEKEKNIYI